MIFLIISYFLISHFTNYKFNKNTHKCVKLYIHITSQNIFVQQMSFTKLLAMILVGIKYYIIIGFLSTILHTIPYTQVIKIDHEVFFLWSTNKVEIEACMGRLHKIKSIIVMCVLWNLSTISGSRSPPKPLISSFFFLPFQTFR